MKRVYEKAKIIKVNDFFKNGNKNILKVEDGYSFGSKEFKLQLMKIVGADIRKLENWYQIVEEIGKVTRREKRKYKKLQEEDSREKMIKQLKLGIFKGRKNYKIYGFEIRKKEYYM